MDSAVGMEKSAGGIEPELLPIVAGYLENRVRDCAEITRLLAFGGMDGITFLAHQMKGSGGSFGFDVISEIGEELEDASRDRDVERVTSALVRLGRFLASVAVPSIRMP